jgi:small subunit ribosomal protein S8
MMTDPIADMLTRIRNAIMAKKRNVDIPTSKLKEQIARILKEEGYVEDYEVVEDSVQGILRIQMRYLGDEMESPIHGLQRVSKPGRRVYRRSDDIMQILGGLGIAIVSTSKGVMTGSNAAEQKVGGEVICSVW